MKNKIKTISLAIVFALIALVALIYINTKMIAKNDTVDVVVAIKTVAHNTEITKSNIDEYFKVEKVSSSVISDKTLKNIDDLLGKYVSVEQIYDKEPVRSDMLSLKEDITKNYKNPVKMSFSVTTFADAVCGRIRAGDTIDIYGVINSSSQDILKNVYVEHVYDSSGVEILNSDSVTNATAFTVIIESGDENELNELLKNSKVIITKI